MGILDFIKKIVDTDNGKTSTIKTPGTDKEPFSTDFERLTKDGELPFGWIYRNKEFTDRIQNEYSYFLNMWLDARSKSPKEQYQALKSFVLYLEDVEKLCKSKGECFEFWFYEILITKDYIAKRKSELDKLTIKLSGKH